MPLRSSTSPVLPRTAKGVSLGALTASLRDGKVKPSGPVIAEAFDALAGKLNTVIEALRNSSPALQEFWVTDANGKPITWIGSRPPYSGLWSAEFYNGGTDPSNAPLFASNDGEVVIGQNGYVHIRDPYGADAAWLGTQYDTLPVTGAANNGSNLVRLTVVGHTYQTGDEAIVAAVGGCEQYTTGAWTVTRVDADHIDLQNSLFGGTYTSGGTVTRLLHVTGAADNGSGLIRLTVTAHGYESGDMVNVASVGGVSNATGQWVISVITANTFDLVGSTFAGAYTSGGICLRYFGGMLAQTFAIGNSFADYKLRALADGSLKIRNATIRLDGTAALIEMDPNQGTISLTGKGASNVLVELSAQDDPITGQQAGLMIKDKTSGDDNHIAFGYDHLNIISGGLLGALLQVGELRLYEPVAGVQQVYFSGGTGDGTIAGNLDCYALKIGGVSTISHARNAILAGVALTGDLTINGATAIDSSRNATLQSLTLPGLTSNALPKAGVGGLLQDSAITDDGTDAAITRSVSGGNATIRVLNTAKTVNDVARLVLTLRNAGNFNNSAAVLAKQTDPAATTNLVEIWTTTGGSFAKRVTISDAGMNIETGSLTVGGVVPYYTKAEVDTLLLGKSSSTHTHTVNSHTHTDPQGGSTGPATPGTSTPI